MWDQHGHRLDTSMQDTWQDCAKQWNQGKLPLEDFVLGVVGITGRDALVEEVDLSAHGQVDKIFSDAEPKCLKEVAAYLLGLNKRLQEKLFWDHIWKPLTGLGWKHTDAAVPRVRYDRAQLVGRVGAAGGGRGLGRHRVVR